MESQDPESRAASLEAEGASTPNGGGQVRQHLVDRASRPQHPECEEEARGPWDPEAGPRPGGQRGPAPRARLHGRTAVSQVKASTRFGPTGPPWPRAQGQPWRCVCGH